jgi:hypothetical protein
MPEDRARETLARGLDQGIDNKSGTARQYEPRCLGGPALCLFLAAHDYLGKKGGEGLFKVKPRNGEHAVSSGKAVA